MFRNSMKYFNAPAMNLMKRQFLPNATKPSVSASSAGGPCRNIMTGVRRLNLADQAGGNYKPTPFQEKILVWTKTYKTIEDIPPRIRREKMGKAMDKFRVKLCIYMTVGFIVMSAIIALLGRRILHREQKKATWQENAQQEQ